METRSGRKREERDDERKERDNDGVEEDETMPVVSPKNDEKRILHIVNKELWVEDPKKVQELLSELGDLCLNDRAGKEHAASNRWASCYFGGPLTIVRQMEKYENVASIQGQGIRALANISFSDGDEIAGHIVGAGAVEKIVLAMTKFPEAEYVQRVACVVLWNLLCTKMISAQRCVIEQDGVRAIVSAMNKFRTSKYIQIYGCLALACLKSAPGGKEAFIEARGLSAIAAAAEKYPDDEDIKKALLILLK